jgi:hypothetical protein
MRRFSPLFAFTLFILPAAAAADDSDSSSDDTKKAWVNRPLALKDFHADFEAGLGFGQYTALSPCPNQPLTVGCGTSQHFGAGSNLEASVGLPFLGDIGIRTGYRFGQDGINSGADYYARLFDHETANLGGDAWANPEIHLRSAFVDLPVFAIGFETRFIVPLANGSDFSAAPGLPIRIRVPDIARIDTGIYLPIEFSSDIAYTISIPAQLWIQIQDAFVGPMSGVRFNHLEACVNGNCVASSRTDVPAGIGGGYTVGGILDIKAQLYTLRINDSDWSKFLGGGLGVGIVVP